MQATHGILNHGVATAIPTSYNPSNLAVRTPIHSQENCLT
jgi:hypothetical protein